MKKIFLLFIFLPLLVAGCGKKTIPENVQVESSKTLSPLSDSNTMENKPAINYLQDEKFAFTLDSQEAVFYLKTGLTGGAGSTAVIDTNTNQLKMWDGKAVYVGSEISDHVAQALKQYSCIQGNPIIRVQAKIQLEEKTFENDSIPGGSKQSYYILNILELQSMDVKATPC